MYAYDMLETTHDLGDSFDGNIVRQYLEQPHWTFTAGLFAGTAFGALAVSLWVWLT